MLKNLEILATWLALLPRLACYGCPIGSPTDVADWICGQSRALAVLEGRLPEPVPVPRVVN